MPSTPVCIAFCIVFGYLLGSIPFGLITAQMRGIDIRKVGSGNIGATNVFRMVGPPYGVAVLVLDFFKGAIPVYIARTLLLGQEVGEPVLSSVLVATGVAAIVGHNYPVWLGFKGGKGIATSGGVLCALVPFTLLVTIVVWVTVLFTSRYVSIASMAAGVAIPITIFTQAWSRNHWNVPLLVFGIVVCALAILRHKSNIQRLMEGTEDSLDTKKKATES